MFCFLYEICKKRKHGIARLPGNQGQRSRSL